MKKLPIGEQTFSELINPNTLYVDKTQYLYNLIRQGRGRYFFSRPRRFGKSLTCSTLSAIFSGCKELFKDLWIGQSDYEWVARPVLFFDFSQIDHRAADVLTQGLHSSLDAHAEKYSIVLKEKLLKAKFAELIQTLGTTKGSVVVIIDEYDKPIVDLINDLEQAELSRNELKDFYGTLKGKDVDANMHFLFITGVSKFSKVALFSDLNNLDDLTNDHRTAALVGYTDQEIDRYLTEHIQAFAEKRGESYEQTRQTLKSWYNGYCFVGNNLKVYNPFSMHNCLTKLDLRNYWFTSGTPSFLMKFIEKNPLIAADIEMVEGSFFAESNLDSFTLDLYYQNYRTLLLQTGYLTFASDYDSNKRGYKVAYPNEEVRYSMTEQIMQFVGGITPENFGEFGDRFRRALAADDLGLFCKHLQDFIKLVPHNIRVNREKFYHQIFFMVCVLFGRRPPTEVATEEGFMDLLLEGTKYTFVIEFKRNSTPEIALKQIEEKRYWEPYEILKTKKVILAGITFNQTSDGIAVLHKTKELF
ncbi:AAA family ATPase [Candidatus Dependentiae bacterium]|nr:AAA family ATPase [Candidatus Dependentiae bacterium]